MLTVACIKWGAKYKGEYVTRLRSMCARHLPEPHEFVCFTDDPVADVECRPLLCDYPGWWQKIGIWKPGAIPGRKLYLDLDVMLTAAVTLPALNGKPYLLDDFSYSIRNPQKVYDPHLYKVLGSVGDPDAPGTVNSSVAYWEGNEGAEIWDRFTPEVMNELHGDQNWVTKVLYPDGFELFAPGFACSYRYSILMGNAVAPIVVFHGEPKPHDLRSETLVDRCWR